MFHSVAAFNNSGFDILGGMQNLIPYQSDVLLNLVTCALIIFGGLGFLVMLDIRRAGSFRKLTFHSKVVITTTAALLIAGTLLLKATEDMTWLGAFFHSVSARTAGFSTYSMGELTNAGLFTLILLMFIGASPGSTGGGIKTTTFFALMQQVRAVFTKKKPGGFHRTLPGEAIDKAESSPCCPWWWCAWGPSCCACWSRSWTLCGCCLRRSPPSARWDCPPGLPPI